MIETSDDPRKHTRDGDRIDPTADIDDVARLNHGLSTVVTGNSRLTVKTSET